MMLFALNIFIQKFMKRKSPKPFENSWAVTYRKPNYDALDDPHASYYFLGRPMKKHLLNLRKSIDNEGKHTQKKKINRMINKRLREQNQANRSTKVEAYFEHLRSQSSSASIYHSTDILQKQLKQQRSKTKISQGAKEYTRSNSKHKSIRRQTNLPKLKNQTINVRKQRQQFYAPVGHKKVENSESNEMEKIEKLNKTEHKKFLSFLMNKRKTIEVHMREDPETQNS